MSPRISPSYRLSVIADHPSVAAAVRMSPAVQIFREFANHEDCLRQGES